MTSSIRQLRAKAQGRPRRKRLNFWVRNETRCFTLAVAANQLYSARVWFKKVAFQVFPVKCVELLLPGLFIKSFMNPASKINQRLF